MWCLLQGMSCLKYFIRFTWKNGPKRNHSTIVFVIVWNVFVFEMWKKLTTQFRWFHKSGGLWMHFSYHECVSVHIGDDPVVRGEADGGEKERNHCKDRRKGKQKVVTVALGHGDTQMNSRPGKRHEIPLSESLKIKILGTEIFLMRTGMRAVNSLLCPMKQVAIRLARFLLLFGPCGVSSAISGTLVVRSQDAEQLEEKGNVFLLMGVLTQSPKCLHATL